MIHLRRPLVVALLSFLTGLLLTLRFTIPPQLAAAGFFTLLVLASALPPRYRDLRGRAEPYLLALLLLTTGGVVGSFARIEAGADCRRTLVDDDRTVALGLLAAPLRPPEDGASAPLLPLLVSRIDGSAACAGEIRVRLPKDMDALPAGTRIELHGRWRTYAPPIVPTAWPTHPRFAGFLVADSARLVPGELPSPWLRLRSRADQRIAEIFPRHAPLVEALVLGRREYLDPAVRDRFARAGLAHLLAISGMHVGLLAGALLLLGSALRVPRRTAIYATLVTTWLYLLVIGAPASALRAAAMISIVLLSYLLQRPSTPSAIIAAAAFTILALRPTAILEPGFQLSFAGVLGILFLREPLLRLLPRSFHHRGLPRTLADGVIVGIAAFLATAPIVAHHFGIVAPISILAGFPAVPLMSLGLVGALAALVSDPLLPSAAALFADGAGLALDALDRLAAAAAAIPFGNGEVPRPPWWSWGASLAAALLANAAFPRIRPRIRVATAFSSAVAVLLVWPVVATGTHTGLDVHFIDVGQGDAIAIRTPGGHWVLVDTGPATAGFDAGATRVVPFLRARGVRRIEALVLTHPDLDHIGGAPAVIAAIPVRYLFEPGLAVGKESYLGVLGTVEAAAAQWRAARTGRTLHLDGVRFDFLWPDTETIDVAPDANEISAVIRIAYGDFALLLTGDAGVGVERILAGRHDDALRASVLKLGHHGSTTSTDELFLDLVQPELAVVSAGRRNRYGHPAPSVLERLDRRGIPIARTDRDGTVTLRVTPGGADWRWLN